VDSNQSPRVHVVIPTLSTSRTTNVVALATLFSSAGFTVAVVANGEAARSALEGHDVRVTSAGANLGFAGAVNLGAELANPQTRWILIVNDDIELTSLEPLESLGGLSDNKIGMVTFGDEPVRRIPGMARVLSSIALLSGIARRFGKPDVPQPGVISKSLFAPFSFVAVDSSVWRRLGGLDERFPFTYEDADFVRRCNAAGTIRVTIDGHGTIRHLRGLTGRSNVRRIVPVGTWSAYQYLVKWGTPSFVARSLCILALAVRIPLVPFARTNTRDHLAGVGNAAVGLLLSRRPELPRYEDH
jgi:GT2 family glycosyltransferase